jgi:hypothetical protein
MRVASAIHLARRHYVWAGILTATIPMLLAYAIYWLAPWGCDANAWLCLLPLSLIVVAPIAALILPFAVFFNRRRRRPLPDGWLPITLSTGVLAQTGISATSLWLYGDYLRHLYLVDVLIFPQAFVAGAMVGTVFSASLSILSRGARNG